MDEFQECKQNQKASELMSLALDGLLDADDQRWLKHHLASCPLCRAEWQAMRQISALFEQASMAVTPAGFASRVERRLVEKTRKRRRAFGGVAVLTGSLSLAGVTLAAVVLIVLGVIAWNQFGPPPELQQGTSAVSQVASGLGLMGKGVSLFLKDLFLRYGALLIFPIGAGLGVLAGLWTWIFVKRPGSSHRNGYV
jgi:predicted anti-sigma-YlaC factor YlaD